MKTSQCSAGWMKIYEGISKPHSRLCILCLEILFESPLIELYEDFEYTILLTCINYSARKSIFLSWFAQNNRWTVTFVRKRYFSRVKQLFLTKSYLYVILLISEDPIFMVLNEMVIISIFGPPFHVYCNIYGYSIFLLASIPDVIWYNTHNMLGTCENEYTRGSVRWKETEQC